MKFTAALVLALSALLTTLSVRAQNPTPPQPLPEPPREFRGVWVATVANIDWPSKKTLSAAEQRAEIVRILEMCAQTNLNAVVLQVRPTADAIFPGGPEPWSEFLTGRSGQPPRPEYDPLAEWVKEAHARGIEVHAWFNPFRARHFRAEHPDHATHVSKRRPEWVRSYDQYLWLDPGVAEAREHSLAVILDVVNRYDIDGVHLDDYFYPYPKAGVPFPDSAPYNAYRAAGGTLDVAAWRRSNIDSFMRELYTRTKAAKPHIAVGISPFGIWRPGFPPGIQGFDAYEQLAADARRWLREGWLDYIAPQLYWPIDQAPQSYPRLLDWWIANNDQQRHIWVGNYTSRILAADTREKSWEPAEIVNQIAVTRSRDLGPGGASGNIHFSAIALLENRRGIATTLARGPYAITALPPAMPWLAPRDTPPPAAPRLRINNGLAYPEPTEGARPRSWVMQSFDGTTLRTIVRPADGRGLELPPDGVAWNIRGLDGARRLGQPATRGTP